MLGTKIYKPIGTQEKCDEYSKLASWCNENNATIKDEGEYFEVVNVVVPETTDEEKAEAIRAERDQKLNETEWAVSRHREEQEMVQAKEIPGTTLTESEYAELVGYRQKLRRIPQQPEFPKIVEWPIEPSFMLSNNVKGV